jgi:hypothetical protein
MNEHHIKERLDSALHRGGHKATEAELVGVTAVILAVVGEVVGELAVVIAELRDRVDALDAAGASA